MNQIEVFGIDGHLVRSIKNISDVVYDIDFFNRAGVHVLRIQDAMGETSCFNE